MICGLLQLPRISTREDDCTGRGTFRIGRIGALKQDSLPGQPVKRRSFHPRGSVGAGIAKAPVISNRKKNIRPWCCSDQWKAQQSRQQEPKGERHEAVIPDGGSFASAQASRRINLLAEREEKVATRTGLEPVLPP